MRRKYIRTPPKTEFFLFFSDSDRSIDRKSQKKKSRGEKKKKMAVVKMMKWRGRPSKKFEAKVTLHHLRIAGGGVNFLDCSRRFSIEITWKGSQSKGIIGLRKKRRVRRNFTMEQPEDLGGDDDGVVVWDEEFRSVCSFSSSSNHKHNDAAAAALFLPWDISFTLFLNGGLNQGTKNNTVPVIATASLNLADFASAPEKQNTEISIPLSILPGGLIDANTSASLYLSVSLLELRNLEEPSHTILSFPRSPCYGEILSSKKEATKIEKKKIPTRKRSQKRGNIFEGLSAIRAKRTSHEEEYCSDGNSSVRSEEDIDEVTEDSGVKKSFDYGTLAYANNAGASSVHRSNTSSSEDEDWIYYSHSRSSSSSSAYNPPQTDQNSSKRGILLPWRKRKLSFRSPKEVKGEPLLRKDHLEEGGDDIDFDRRHLSSSSDESTTTSTEGGGDYPFGDDNFAVGTWESKEIISRNGEMKLKTQVFFGSIDQRSERAAGESACTALVAVIAHWFQSNGGDGAVMPIKSQLDSLIREGSLEWRNLCENETYKERFPDKHFDLDTVLEAQVRPISVVPEKSFVGFFQPQQGTEDKGFDFLQGAMSFDDIWDEIPSGSDPLVYIISWNDHFFILKVEEDAYYIIDTLGERLYEGCNQAFILKFDRDTVIHRNIPAEHSDPPESTEIVVCTGKESCKEYIKNFLAAIPIRELEVDLKKGLMASTTHLHQRLQIEFHYTRCLQNLTNECSTAEAIDNSDAANANLSTSESEE
ncbi:hypothetical protein ABFS82_06G081300 [Erythranthe guttata]